MVCLFSPYILYSFPQHMPFSILLPYSLLLLPFLNSLHPLLAPWFCSPASLISNTLLTLDLPRKIVSFWNIPIATREMWDFSYFFKLCNSGALVLCQRLCISVLNSTFWQTKVGSLESALVVGVSHLYHGNLQVLQIRAWCCPPNQLVYEEHVAQEITYR